MVFMVGLTVAQILCRVFFQALVWSEELVRFSLVAASLVGASVAFYRGSHISISFLTDRLPSGLRLAVQVAMRLGAVAFFVVVAWYGWVLMGTETFQTTPALGISMRWGLRYVPVVWGSRDTPSCSWICRSDGGRTLMARFWQVLFFC